MILTFSKEVFKQKIIEGTKVHTIRSDKSNRWKVGNKIHFWLGNPRNTRGKNKPHQFGIGEVDRVETIRIDFLTNTVYIGNDIVLKNIEELNALARNDGFDNWWQMREWFINDDRQYFGKIIFWKDFVKDKVNPNLIIN